MVTDTNSDFNDEQDYQPPTVKGNVYKWKRRPTFDQVLCELPEEIAVLATGQAIALYGRSYEGPLQYTPDGKLRPQRISGYVPPVPYEGLDELLAEHCQGCLGEEDLRAALQDVPARTIAYTRSELESIKNKAIEYWGEFGVKFRPRLV